MRESLTVADGMVEWAELRQDDDTIDARVCFDIEHVADDQRDWLRELIEDGTGTFSVTIEDEEGEE